ncbi:MAG: glucosamine-6-phosphate deaminase [Alphaproteobacteria bacterium]|nr:glucosamine-6-phosphate deaminase [Alphaproteobacteria bacterium]
MIAIFKHATAIEAADTAARQVADALRANPDLVLGLATGGTMRPFNAALARMYREGLVSFARATIFNLDDHVGVPADHPKSFRRFMRETLFDLVDADPARCFMPDGMARDLDAEAAGYEARIAASGGIDLQILGLGHNGHIAYNEPGAPHDSRTRAVTLTADTVMRAAADFSPVPAPSRGLTMGIGTILDARRIVLIANGAGKAEAVAQALRPPPRLDCPASALQRHSDVAFHLDMEASALLDSIRPTDGFRFTR